MDSVGIRELRQNLSKHIARVKRGETIEVTEHGRTVAVIQPAPISDDPWDRLIATGRLIPPKGRLSDLPPLEGEIDPELSERMRLALEEQRADRP